MTSSFVVLAAEEEEEWDDMGGVRAYSTIYFDRYDNIYCGLYKVTGGWEIQDHQATVSNRYLHMGQAGFTKTGYFSDDREYYPTSNTFSKSAPSHWNTETNAVNTLYAGHSIGAITEADVSYQQGGDYHIELKNHI